jgi:calcineurin-like phosphoesterase family protein
MSRINWFFVVVFVMLTACETSKNIYLNEYEMPPLPDKEVPEHTMFLIGDAGIPDSAPLEPTLVLLKQKMDAVEDSMSSIVFLGDNIYPRGLHPKNHSMRPEDEQHINSQMDILEGYEGRIAFIPGNHDWKEGKEDGLEFVRRQERYVEDYLDRGNVFLPSNGCPGPIEIRLTERLTWIIIDTQWWLHENEKSFGDQDDCEIYTEDEFLFQVQDVLKKNRNNQVIISAHHPLYSNGNHGGHFPFMEHLFPLTKKKPRLYIPMPIAGSVYPFYRGLIGDIQDIPHYKYTALRNYLTAIFDRYEDIVYTSGHDHNLQYQKHGNAHYVVSGAGSKQSYLRQNENLIYGKADKGFATLQSYKNGDLWLEFYSPNAEDPQTPTYRTQLRAGHRVLTTEEEAITTLEKQDSVVTVVPGGEYYDRGPVKDFIMGELYRDVWNAPITVPVIDLSEEHGGLEPIKRGGGMQSKSLRLEAPDGKQYVLRSINKFPATILPPELQKTFVTEIIQDVIAASHPYAAVAVPPLANAAGVYHTNPKLVYVPDDPILGPFRSEFAGMLCLYEERPDDDQRDMDNFGNSPDVESSWKVIEEVRENYDDKVDAHSFLRARLFDMIIGDWDRHDDQWRWSKIEYEDSTIYKPIPRDRDQVFYTVDGLVPNIVNRKWLERRFQPFEEEIRDMRGFNFNGKYVDRAYLDELEWKDWQMVVDSLQYLLTDSVFREGLAQLPDTAYALDGERLFRTLQIHRDKLDEWARRYYEILAEDVDVVGTYKEEYFEVVRMNDDSTRVRIYPKKDDKPEKEDRIVYERMFLTDETDEIRLYGLDNEDVYVLEGEVSDGPLIRIVGGPADDRYINESNVKGLKRKLEVHESKQAAHQNPNNFDLGKDSKLFLAEDDRAVTYRRNHFMYNVTMPLITAGFNPDDGIFLGGGVQITRHGFNRKPYDYRHRLTGQYAIATGAYEFDYSFDYRSIFHSKWDFTGELNVLAPDYLFNYFGAGNETEWISDDFRDNRLRLNFVEFKPGFARSSEGDLHRLTLGPTYLMVRPPEELGDDELFEFRGLVEDLDFGVQNYLGARARYDLNNVDNQKTPHRGMRFHAELSYTDGLDDDRTDFFRASTDLTFYVPLSVLPNRFTIAFRTGTAANFGDYPFFLSNFLDGYENLRGFRRNRFAGDVTFYNNLDLRLKLLDVENYVLPFGMGTFAHADLGRVWLDGEDSRVWHSSVGAGLYFNIIDFIVLTTSYSLSKDDQVVLVQFGFFF